MVNEMRFCSFISKPILFSLAVIFCIYLILLLERKLPAKTEADIEWETFEAKDKNDSLEKERTEPFIEPSFKVPIVTENKELQPGKETASDTNQANITIEKNPIQADEPKRDAVRNVSASVTVGDDS